MPSTTVLSFFLFCYIYFKTSITWLLCLIHIVFFLSNCCELGECHYRKTWAIKFWHRGGEFYHYWLIDSRPCILDDIVFTFECNTILHISFSTFIPWWLLFPLAWFFDNSPDPAIFVWYYKLILSYFVESSTRICMLRIDTAYMAISCLSLFKFSAIRYIWAMWLD